VATKKSYLDNLNLDQFTIVKSVNVEFVTNGAKLNVSGETPADSWADLEFVVIESDDLKEVITKLYSLRKQ
jgi:hypothetical protein